MAIGHNDRKLEKIHPVGTELRKSRRRIPFEVYDNNR